MYVTLLSTEYSKTDEIYFINLKVLLDLIYKYPSLELKRFFYTFIPICTNYFLYTIDPPREDIDKRTGLCVTNEFYCSNTTLIEDLKLGRYLIHKYTYHEDEEDFLPRNVALNRATFEEICNLVNIGISKTQFNIFNRLFHNTLYIPNRNISIEMTEILN